jgi:hypothetical protein
VKNWAQKTVKVKKVLNDILLSSTRTFNFTYSFVSPLDGSTQSGAFTLAPISNNAAGAVRNLIIPVNAMNLVITELTTGDYAAIAETYDTTDEGVWDNNGSPAPITDGNYSETVFQVATVTDDGTVTFTNTRKTVDVTVTKRVTGSGGTFRFEALLEYSSVISGYKLYTDEYHVNPDIVTESDGKAAFQLTATSGSPGTIILKVPYGSRLTITEATTVTFLNTEVHVAPTGVKTKTLPFRWMLLFGVLLMLGTSLPVEFFRRRRRRRA